MKFACLFFPSHDWDDKLYVVDGLLFLVGGYFLFVYVHRASCAVCTVCQLLFFCGGFELAIVGAAAAFELPFSFVCVWGGGCCWRISW